MDLSKKLIISSLIIAGMAQAGPGSFRGLSSEAVRQQTIPLSFRPLIAQQYGISPDRIPAQRGDFLIISADAWAPYLQDYVTFKKSQGFRTSMVTLEEIGYTANEIKNYITQQLADNPMLEYILLVGDVDGVSSMPSYYYGPENDVSDQRYTHIYGNDWIPDVFIGRFSVDSNLELAVTMQKTIHYHRDPLNAPEGWLGRGLVVAGNYSNTFPIPVTPKWTSNWVKEELELVGYTQVDTVYYPPIQQGAPFIQSYLNAGVGIVNYRGWGDANGWHYPEFHVDDVSNLNNGWMTPVFTSFVCNANDFANTVDPCLGESLIRAGTISVPKGGVAVIGPSDLHTSTKYNNVINAYMYDAMLDEGNLELAPAMLAGQMGVYEEFPDQDGSEEAQEMYSHVYNLLGDPSLTVHIGTPQEFDVTIEPVSANDGFVVLHILDESGQPVSDAVVALLVNEDLLARGITDQNGEIALSADLTAVSTADVYVNKAGFVQAHSSVDIQAADQAIIILGHTLDAGSNNQADIGETITVYPILKNVSGNTVSAGNGILSSETGIQVISSSFSFSEMAAGESITASTGGQIRVLPEENESTRHQFLVEESSGNWSGNQALRVNRPHLDVNVAWEFSGEHTATPVLSIQNLGAFSAENFSINLDSRSDSLTITDTGTNSDTCTITAWQSKTWILDHISAAWGDVSQGSALSYDITLWQDTVALYRGSDNVRLQPDLASDPVPPSQYGYWAYDNSDTDYPFAPTFEWVELDPEFGGSGGMEYRLYDDDHVNVDLPFTFRFFGRDYTTMTINSNGWVSFVPCNIDYFWNFTIPMAMGPRAQIAAFWDDLEVVGTDSIRVYTQSDPDNHRFIIEWSRALNGYDEATEETFELILYDPQEVTTPTGDGIIDVQYLEIADVDIEKNYATVGIESHDQNDGIQYVFNNTYAPGAAPLTNNRIIRFTTQSPENYVPSLQVEDEVVPTRIQLKAPYPNPFNPRTTLEFELPNPMRVTGKIVDLRGREVSRLFTGNSAAGRHRISWNGTGKSGKTVSSGIYFFVLETSSGIHTQKLILLK